MSKIIKDRHITIRNISADSFDSLPSNTNETSDIMSPNHDGSISPRCRKNRFSKICQNIQEDAKPKKVIVKPLHFKINIEQTRSKRIHSPQFESHEILKKKEDLVDITNLDANLKISTALKSNYNNDFQDNENDHSDVIENYKPGRERILDENDKILPQEVFYEELKIVNQTNRSIHRDYDEEVKDCLSMRFSNDNDNKDDLVKVLIKSNIQSFCTQNSDGDYIQTPAIQVNYHNQVSLNDSPVAKSFLEPFTSEQALPCTLNNDQIAESNKNDRVEVTHLLYKPKTFVTLKKPLLSPMKAVEQEFKENLELEYEVSMKDQEGSSARYCRETEFEDNQCGMNQNLIDADYNKEFKACKNDNKNNLGLETIENQSGATTRRNDLAAEEILTFFAEIESSAKLKERNPGNSIRLENSSSRISEIGAFSISLNKKDVLEFQNSQSFIKKSNIQSSNATPSRRDKQSDKQSDNTFFYTPTSLVSRSQSFIPKKGESFQCTDERMSHKDLSEVSGFSNPNEKISFVITKSISELQKFDNNVLLANLTKNENKIDSESPFKLEYENNNQVKPTMNINGSKSNRLFTLEQDFLDGISPRIEEKNAVNSALKVSPIEKEPLPKIETMFAKKSEPTESQSNQIDNKISHPYTEKSMDIAIELKNYNTNDSTLNLPENNLKKTNEVTKATNHVSERIPHQNQAGIHKKSSKTLIKVSKPSNPDNPHIKSIANAHETRNGEINDNQKPNNMPTQLEKHHMQTQQEKKDIPSDFEKKPANNPKLGLTNLLNSNPTPSLIEKSIHVIKFDLETERSMPQQLPCSGDKTGQTPCNDISKSTNKKGIISSYQQLTLDPTAPNTFDYFYHSISSPKTNTAQLIPTNVQDIITTSIETTPINIKLNNDLIKSPTKPFNTTNTSTSIQIENNSQNYVGFDGIKKLDTNQYPYFADIMNSYEKFKKQNLSLQTLSSMPNLKINLNLSEQFDTIINQSPNNTNINNSLNHLYQYRPESRLSSDGISPTPRIFCPWNNQSTSNMISIHDLPHSKQNEWESKSKSPIRIKINEVNYSYINLKDKKASPIEKKQERISNRNIEINREYLLNYQRSRSRESKLRTRCSTSKNYDTNNNNGNNNNNNKSRHPIHIHINSTIDGVETNTREDFLASHRRRTTNIVNIQNRELYSVSPINCTQIKEISLNTSELDNIKITSPSSSSVNNSHVQYTEQSSKICQDLHNKFNKFYQLSMDMSTAYKNNHDISTTSNKLSTLGIEFESCHSRSSTSCLEKSIQPSSIFSDIKKDSCGYLSPPSHFDSLFTQRRKVNLHKNNFSQNLYAVSKPKSERRFTEIQDYSMSIEENNANNTLGIITYSNTNQDRIREDNSLQIGRIRTTSNENLIGNAALRARRIKMKQPKVNDDKFNVELLKKGQEKFIFNTLPDIVEKPNTQMQTSITPSNKGSARYFDLSKINDQKYIKPNRIESKLTYKAKSINDEQNQTYGLIQLAEIKNQNSAPLKKLNSLNKKTEKENGLNVNSIEINKIKVVNTANSNNTNKKPVINTNSKKKDNVVKITHKGMKSIDLLRNDKKNLLSTSNRKDKTIEPKYIIDFPNKLKNTNNVQSLSNQFVTQSNQQYVNDFEKCSFSLLEK